MIGVREGSFLMVNMDRCKDITGWPFEHVTPAKKLTNLRYNFKTSKLNLFIVKYPMLPYTA